MKITNLQRKIVSYANHQMADDYCTWDDSAAWLLGYSFLPHALGLSKETSAHLLDVGCGPGTVTRWLADHFPVQITAVDASPAMIEIARQHQSHHSIEYRLGSGSSMPFLASGSVDAATTCFLFTCIDDEQTIRDVMAEVARVLRPGGRFTILVPHPEQVSGAQFTGFQRGEVGKHYTAGDHIPVRVRRLDSTYMTVVNRYWTRETYFRALTKAGFGEPAELAPVLADAEEIADPALFGGNEWDHERTAPPFLLVTAARQP